MDYRGAYKELAQAVWGHGVVFDSSYFGSASRVTKNQVAIVVNPALSWRNRLFTLAHEVGHYFRLVDESLVPAKRIANEALANRRAVKILEWLLDEDVTAPYFNFYKRVLRLPKPETWNHDPSKK